MTDSLWPQVARAPRSSRAAGALQALVRRRLHASLAALERGEIELREDGVARRFGRPDPALPLGGVLEVRSPRFFGRLALRGTLGAAESWMQGEWHSPDLAALVRILTRNPEAMALLDRGPARLAEPLARIGHWLRPNTRRGARRNIQAHYDLGNDFFAAFLDPTLTYSAGLFERPGATLEEASRAKYERLCRKLELGPDDHVLEIGTGWGGFCLHAASRTGCRVTSATLSPSQRTFAEQRVAEAGLADRVRIVERDYRELGGTYDKLVSIEMIEAVGHENLPTWFRVCADRLAPEGRAAIQAIVIRDQAYERARRTVDFIKRYVFPGGCLPSVGALVQAASRASDLRLVHLEDLTPHYGETLRRWRERFLANRAQIRALGYPETLLRTWEFYLGYCEAGFEERHIGVVQLVFERAAGRGRPLLGELPAVGPG
jgi:cyclopropane-fatty-acyl-phospholipid synthase